MEKIRILFTAALCALFLLSCDDMDSIHQKYLDQGERVYVGKLDSIRSYPGHQRIKLVWSQSSDPDIAKTVIYWNQRQDSITLDFERKTGGIQTDSVIIGNLEEGTYNFELLNKNEKGDASLVSSVQGVSFGKAYEEGLKFPGIKDIQMTAYDKDAKSSTVKINFNIPASAIGMMVRYKKVGAEKETSLFVRETSVELTNVGNRLWDENDLIKISCLYVPEQSIDTLESKTIRQQIVLYTVTSGYRREFSATGAAGAVTQYGIDSPAKTVVDKHFWLTSQENILGCNRLGSFGIMTDFSLFQYFLQLNEGNLFSISGVSYSSANVVSYTISNMEGENCTFDPETKEIKLNNMRTLTSKATTIFEETLIPKF